MNIKKIIALLIFLTVTKQEMEGYVAHFYPYKNLMIISNQNDHQFTTNCTKQTVNQEQFSSIPIGEEEYNGQIQSQNTNEQQQKLDSNQVVDQAIVDGITEGSDEKEKIENLLQKVSCNKIKLNEKYELQIFIALSRILL